MGGGVVKNKCFLIWVGTKQEHSYTQICDVYKATDYQQCIFKDEVLIFLSVLPKYTMATTAFGSTIE